MSRVSWFVSRQTERSRRPARRRFTIARGSASECAAILDLLHARAVVKAELHQEGRTLLVRIIQMLSRLTLVAGRPWPAPRP